MHPQATPTRLPRWGPRRRLRCSSLKYSRYSRSSRLACGAPRPSRCDARLSPRAVKVFSACSASNVAFLHKLFSAGPWADVVSGFSAARRGVAAHDVVERIALDRLAAGRQHEALELA